MAQPLPDGWVDLGITATVPVSGSVQLWVTDFAYDPIPDAPPSGPGAVGAVFSGFPYQWSIVGAGGANSGEIYAVRYWLTGPDIFDDMGNAYLLIIDREQHGSSPDGASGVYTYTSNTGPYRLGMRYTLINPASPQFAQRDYEVEYGWFLDWNTQNYTTFAGHDYTWWAQAAADGTFPWSGAQSGTNFTPVGPYLLAGPLQFLGGGYGIPKGTLVVYFSGLTVNGEIVDTSDGIAGGLVGLGDGTAAAYAIPGQSVGGGGTAYPSSFFSEDIDISQFGAGSTGAQVLDADGKVQVVPYQSQRSIRHVDWVPDALSSTRSFSINPPWAAAQPVPFRPDDLQVPMMMGPRQTGKGTYSPVSVTVERSLDVNRPDGNIPSTWSGEDVTVIENADGSVFMPGPLGSAVTRTLTQQWKNRVGLGPLGTGDPNFALGEYAHTKHEPGEDIYCWDTYAYLQVDISGSDSLLLTLDGSCLSVIDPHNGGTDGYTASLVGFSLQYNITSDRKIIDLCFPCNVDGPVYPSRIDAITISNLSSLYYNLSGLELQAQGGAYLKVDFGPPVQGEDYSALMLAVDGSFPTGSLPDQAYKWDEVGAAPQAGGGIRYITPFQPGLILDYQLSLSDFWAALNNMEGISAPYDSAVSESALTDRYGVSLEPELAQWLRPVVPYQFSSPGGTYQPPCSLQCKQVVITNLVPYTIYSRWNAGFGAIEALAVLPDYPTPTQRAPQGVAIAAWEHRLGRVATGTTDGFGYVVVTPVPANAEKTVELAQV